MTVPDTPALVCPAVVGFRTRQMLAARRTTCSAACCRSGVPETPAFAVSGRLTREARPARWAPSSPSRYRHRRHHQRRQRPRATAPPCTGARRPALSRCRCTTPSPSNATCAAAARPWARTSSTSRPSMRCKVEISARLVGGNLTARATAAQASRALLLPSIRGRPRKGLVSSWRGRGARGLEQRQTTLNRGLQVGTIQTSPRLRRGGGGTAHRLGCRGRCGLSAAGSLSWTAGVTAPAPPGCSPTPSTSTTTTVTSTAIVIDSTTIVASSPAFTAPTPPPYTTTTSTTATVTSAASVTGPHLRHRPASRSPVPRRHRPSRSPVPRRHRP